MDTLLSLKVFAAVAEQKSFTAVAQRLGLSPAMTSKHIKHVEARLGARLLNRNSRNVSLTEAGARYLDTVKPLLEELQDAEAQVSQTTLAVSGTLKMSMPIWMANPLFTRVLAAYQLENPNVVLDLDMNGKMVNLVENGIDLALRVTETIGDGMIMRKLASVDFRLVGSPALLDKIGRPTEISDLNGMPLLAYAPVAGSGRVKFPKGQSFEQVQFRPVLLTENETLIVLAARESMGLAILPYSLVAEDVDKGTLETLLPKNRTISVPFRAIYPDRSYMPAKVRSILDFLAGPKGLSSMSKFKVM